MNLTIAIDDINPKKEWRILGEWVTEEEKQYIVDCIKKG